MSGNDGDKPSPFGLKAFLDNNPIATLVGLGVTVAGVVAGVMTYYTNQKLEVAEAQHRIGVAHLENKQRGDLLDAVTPLKEKIGDLTSRVVSIERRIPGSKPDYLDVTTITIAPEQVRELDAKHRSLIGGRLYVNVPSMADWSFTETNELEVAKEMYGSLMTDIPRSAADMVSKSSALLWRRNRNLKFRLDSPGLSNLGTPPIFAFFPAIVVQDINTGFMQQRAKDFISLMDRSRQETESSLNLARDVLAKSKNLVGAENGESSETSSGHSEQQVSSQESERSAENNTDSKLTTGIEVADIKQKLLDALSDVISSDLASYALTDTLFQAFIQSMGLGIKHKILSAQKKGNLWYI